MHPEGETMAEKLQHLRQRARSEKKGNKKLLKRLARKPPKDLDQTVMAIHEEVFEHTQCLMCANCCKTSSPIFHDKDIERIAAQLRLRPGDFVEKYLKLDNEGDYVLQTVPCPFLGEANYCSIYEVRPRACREYPHSNRKGFLKRAKWTLSNTNVCPATLEILKRLREVVEA